MAAPEDLRLALAALRKGLITRDQLSTYLAERPDQDDSPSLAEALVASGVLTRDQVALLQSEVLPAANQQATLVADGLPIPGAGAGVEYRTKIGDYTLLGVLGRGGMGVVYVAMHEALRRKVALKVLPPAIARDERSLARFLREVRAAARLHHPGIVPVYDFGREGDTWFFAMEYVEGPTLEEEIAKGPLDPIRAAHILQQAAEALHTAHVAGIIHRDIKPSNIILATGDRALLTDFGIARELSEGGLTASGSMLGTPYYMSPEMAGGTHGVPDARSDVYSLGATLYESLTGKKPFEATSFEMVLARVLLAEPVAPRCLRRDLPRDLETVTLKAMAKDPAHRYPTALAFAEELGRVTRGEPVQAHPITRVERIVRRYRANRELILAASLCLACLVALAGKMLIEASLDRRRLEEERDAQAAQARARVRQEEALRHRVELRTQARSFLRQAEIVRGQSWQEALRFLDQAVAVDPTFHEPLLARADAYKDEGMYPEAIRDLGTAINLAPDCVEAYAGRALLEFWTHDNLRAIADVDRIVRLKPDHPYSVLAQGAIGYINGRLDLAAQAFEKALERDPKNGVGWACLGGTLLEMDKNEEGLRALEKALQLDPHNFMALSSRSAYHLRFRRYEEALRDATKAIENGPGLPLPYLVRGKAYFGLGKLDLAREDLDKAVKRMPHDGEPYLARTRLHYRLGEYADAARDAAVAIRLKYAVIEARTLKGMARALSGDPVGALEEAEALEKEKGGAPDAAALRGAAYLASGENERAAAFLDEFIEHNPDAGRATLVRGRVYLAEKNFGRAFKELMTAIRIDPDLKDEAQPDVQRARAGMEGAEDK